MAATPRRPAQRYLEYTPGAVPAGGAAVLSRSNAAPVVGDSKEAAGRAFHHKVLIKLGLAQPGAWLRAWARVGGVRVCSARAWARWRRGRLGRKAPFPVCLSLTFWLCRRRCRRCRRDAQTWTRMTMRSCR
jgi:hypothetical protein